jgi:GDP-mannose 6-dehydrogenase
MGKGYDLRIYDRNASSASLVGTNRDFIFNRIPHISRLRVDKIDAVLDHAQTIAIGNNHPVSERLRDGQFLVDFVGITDQRSVNGNNAGICW